MNSLIGATSSPWLAWQVRSRPLWTQLITSLQATQGFGSSFISTVFFVMTLLTGMGMTEASPCASLCRLIMICVMLRCHRLRARLGQVHMEIGLFILSTTASGNIWMVHSSPGSTSKNLRLPRGWVHRYSTWVQIRSWWLSSMEDSNLSSSQPLLGLHELWSCCYLRQACCRPYFHTLMDIAQKSIYVHGWVLWCNSIWGSCVCCHHSWHCFSMESWYFLYVCLPP